jgi:hypothetical protein
MTPIGTVESWVERTVTMPRRSPPERLNIRLQAPVAGYGPPYPSRDETCEAILRFGDEVLPAMRHKINRP